MITEKSINRSSNSALFIFSVLILVFITVRATKIEILTEFMEKSEINNRLVDHSHIRKAVTFVVFVGFSG